MIMKSYQILISCLRILLIIIATIRTGLKASGENTYNTQLDWLCNYNKMNQLYRQQFEEMQKMNQQWFNLFWRPFMSQQEKEAEEEG
jgi:hypothetical protein